MKSILLTSIIATGLAACATAASDNSPKGIMKFADDPHLGAEVDKICFNRTIDGFSNATRDTVVLQKGVSNYHIVEVSGVCRNLRDAQSIGIDSTGSCVRRGDYLLVSTSAFSLDDKTGIGPDRCYIKKIHKWDKNAEDNMEDSEES